MPVYFGGTSLGPAILQGRFEAPHKTQQVWFIRKLRTDVNLGNIATFDVIPLKTRRLGLRGGTMPDSHDRKTWNLEPEGG